MKPYIWWRFAAGVAVASAGITLVHASQADSAIRFALKHISFRLENDETPAKNTPETMAGGRAAIPK
ncbi:MAG: hypothetical protein ACYCSN_07735 [Acidobacteriaceae bacterium]